MKDLTPSELEALEAWRNCDASRLLLTLEEALREMEREQSAPPEFKTEELLQKIFDSIKSGEMTVAQFEKLLRSPKQIESILKKKIYNHTDPLVIRSLENWRKFYESCFGLDLNVSEVRVPERVQGFDQLIVVNESISFATIWYTSKAVSKIEIYNYFVKDAVIVSDRQSDQPYAVWARASGCPDKDLMGRSVNNIRGSGIDVMTLEEWLLLEMFLVLIYRKTPNALTYSLMDSMDTWTLCAGTLLGANCSPAVKYNLTSDTINISYAGFDFNVNNKLGARRVIV